MRIGLYSARAVVGAAAVGMIATSAAAAPGAQTGPSSSASPYVVRSQPGVVTTSSLPVGD